MAKNGNFENKFKDGNPIDIMSVLEQEKKLKDNIILINKKNIFSKFVIETRFKSESINLP